jgi:hypothetical protein
VGVTIELDPADGSKGYAYVERSRRATQVIATARYPYKLDHWEVDGVYERGGPGNYSILLSPDCQDVTVKAFFE